MSAPKPQPCPACKNEVDTDFLFSWQVQCGNCGMRGPLAKTEAEAVQWWNRVVLQPSANGIDHWSDK